MNSRHAADSDTRRDVLVEKTERVGQVEVRHRIYADLPEGFVWINKPVTVIGEDFTYEVICLCSFPKTNGKVRYIVEDRGRLFIQRESQLQWHDESQPRVNSPEFLAAQREIARGLGPKPEDPVTLAVLDDMENELAGRPSQTIGEALELQYNRERNKGDNPLGR